MEVSRAHDKELYMYNNTIVLDGVAWYVCWPMQTASLAQSSHTGVVILVVRLYCAGGGAEAPSLMLWAGAALLHNRPARQTMDSVLYKQIETENHH